jgi:amino acid transporter
MVRESWEYVKRFFPLVLLVQHLKHNRLGLVYWFLLVGIVTDILGKGFGLSYLFLSPEYHEEVSFYSFFILGFSIGGFTMAFHTYSYTKLASNFPFLAMVNKPFLKFCVNNSVLPVGFVMILFIKVARFQYLEEFASTSQILVYLLAMILGMMLFIVASVLFFFRKNKNVYELKHCFQQEAAMDEDPERAKL